MPELPDLVHVEDLLRDALVGKTISAARTGDPTVLRIMVREPFPALLAGRRLETIARRGQFMRFGLEGGLGIVVNAMLAGRYKLIARRRGERQEEGSRARSGWRSASPTRPSFSTWTTSGWARSTWRAPRTKTRSRSTASWASISMSPAFTRAAFGKAIAGRRDQTRAFLMDKRALASIGNAYADEILFAARIHPKTFCRKLQPAEVDALYEAIGRVLREAIAEIRKRNEPPEVKVRDFLKVRGRDGKPCLVCGTTLRAVRVGDGDACFCPTCQPETRKLFVVMVQARPRLAKGEQK